MVDKAMPSEWAQGMAEAALWDALANLPAFLRPPSDREEDQAKVALASYFDRAFDEVVKRGMEECETYADELHEADDMQAYYEVRACIKLLRHLKPDTGRADDAQGSTGVDEA